jgi:site-specific DNA-methyltransferase (adenine-specific)
MSKRLIRRGWWKSTPPGKLIQLPKGDIVRADALQFLCALKDECADVVFLDPPFNLGKSYGKNGSRQDRKKEEDYLAYMEKVVARSSQILRKGGALFLYHIPKWAIRIAPYLEARLDFRHWIAISIKNGFVRGDRLYPAHYALLYYTKGEPATFRRPKIPKPICARCKRDLRDYGGYKAFVANGINLSDVWDDISPVRHRKFKTRVANELPLIIPDRVVAISGCRNGTLVDPFAGSGATLVAAIRQKMRFVACDTESEYCTLMLNRLCLSTKASKKGTE